jgi:hypothetical protein
MPTRETRETCVKKRNGLEVSSSRVASVASDAHVLLISLSILERRTKRTVRGIVGHAQPTLHSAG